MQAHCPNDPRGNREADHLGEIIREHTPAQLPVLRGGGERWVLERWQGVVPAAPEPGIGSEARDRLRSRGARLRVVPQHQSPNLVEQPLHRRSAKRRIGPRRHGRKHKTLHQSRQACK